MSDPTLPVVEQIGDPRAGPTLALLSGVHGDEPEGFLASGMLVNELRDKNLAGALRVVRIANVAAFQESSRTAAANGTNLARVFPGRPDGDPVERAADRITRELITGADLLVDLHSAGRHYEMPVFAGYDGGAATQASAAAAAIAFGAPLVWRHPSIGPGRSLSAASALGVPGIYLEGSGGAGVTSGDLELYRSGVRRLLALLGILATDLAPPAAPRMIVGGNGNVDESIVCTVDGFCVTHVVAGDDVGAGQVIAEVMSADGRVLEVLRAPTAGTIMMLRRTTGVVAGDGIAMIAEVI